MPELTELLPKVILASQSVARKALLVSQGIEVTTYATHCDESHQESDPAKAVALLSERQLECLYGTSSRQCGTGCSAVTRSLPSKGNSSESPATRKEARNSSPRSAERLKRSIQDGRCV